MSAEINFSLKREGASSVEHGDERKAPRKVVDFFLSHLREVPYALTTRYHRMANTYADYSETVREWKANSRGLFVLIHGLRSDPAAWHAQLELLAPQEFFDVFAPIVHERGLCSLEEAADPILPTIVDYAQKHPFKPVCLLGTSNGGRIVSWLEIECRKAAPETPIKISIVAGVLFGSKQMDRLERFGVSSLLYPNVLKEELKYGSDKAQELLQKIDAPRPEGCAGRHYELFATTEDLLIPEFESSLPKLETFNYSSHIIHGESHGSIVSAVAKKQIEECITWMENHYPSVELSQAE